MPAAMEAGNLTSLQPRPYDVPCRREFANVPVGAGEVDRRFEADDVSGGGCEEDMRGGAEVVQVNSAAPPPPCSVDGGGVISSFPIRPSELTVSFEGQIYVFPAVTPDKLQGVLLLLGGIETPESVPSTEFQSQQCNKVLEDVPILLGLYVGTHGLRSSEVIHLRRRFGQWKEDGVTKQSSRIEFYEYVEAVKLTGDPYVPAGQIAFRAKVGKQYQLPHKGIFPEEFGVIARYKGQGRLAEPGFQNPRWVDGELVILDGKYIKGGPVVGFVYWATEYHFLVFFQRLRLQE